MFSLLRADLRRITRRHGGFYGFVIAMVVIGLFTGVIPVLMRSLLASVSQDSAETEAINQALSAPYASPVACAASIMGGIISLLTCLSAMRVCWIDKRNGYDRTIVSSCGKRVYYHEKIAFALVLSAVFTVLALILSVVMGFAVRGITGMDSPIAFVQWFVSTVFVTWACACLCMAVLWLTKSQLITFVLALFLTNGILTGLIGLGVNGLGEQVAKFYQTICEWLPNASVNLSSNLVNGAYAFPVDSLANMVVPALACIALTFLAVGALRKRDL